PDHERAASAAERFLAAIPGLPRPAPTLRQKWSMRLGVAWARAERAVVPLAGLALAGLVLAAIMLIPQNSVAPGPAAIAQNKPATQSFETGPRQRRQLTLADETTVWLDWRSQITVRFTPQTRTIELQRGQVAFSVTKDPERPLLVQAGGVTTRVTGTEFAVRRDTAGVSVDVMEGSVEVLTALRDEPIALHAAQGVKVTPDRAAEVFDLNPEELGTWRDGIIVFRDRPLLEALRVLEPYSSYRLDTARLWDSGATVSGTFFIDRADAALLSVIQTEGLAARTQSPNTLVVTRPRPARP
ncbi:MAG: FecR domain-containing protein, partial [Pseudomonadota bacterium]